MMRQSSIICNEFERRFLNRSVAFFVNVYAGHVVGAPQLSRKGAQAAQEAAGRKCIYRLRITPRKP